MHLAVHTVDIQRMTTIAGQGISKSMSALYTAIPCTVLAMDNQSTIANQWDYGQGYEVYFEATQDVKKGDKLIWGSVSLIVQGVKDYTGYPIVAHKVVLTQREDA